MRWARTLMLADMLTKAIHANVAHDARPATSKTHQSIKESTMGEVDKSLTADTAVPQATTDSTGTVLAPASETTVADTTAPTQDQTTAPSSADSEGGIGTQLDKIAALVQTLQDNPKICALLYALLGIKDADNADATG